MTSHAPIAASIEPDVLRLDVDGPVLLASRCRECGRIWFPQRRRCAVCAEETVEATTLPTTGVLTSFTELRRATAYSAVKAPYILGEVTLDPGVRIYTVVVDAPIESLVAGLPVELVAVEITTASGDPGLGYAFRPAGQVPG
jgi:uncharacterized OB-fold protein